MQDPLLKVFRKYFFLYYRVNYFKFLCGIAAAGWGLLNVTTCIFHTLHFCHNIFYWQTNNPENTQFHHNLTRLTLFFMCMDCKRLLCVNRPMSNFLQCWPTSCLSESDWHGWGMTPFCQKSGECSLTATALFASYFKPCLIQLRCDHLMHLV